MKKTLSIILAVMLISLCIVSCDNNTSTTSLKSIEVTTKPTKLTYTVGESLNTADMVVTATYTNGTSKVVTGYTVDTSVLSTVGTKTVTVSFTQNGVTRTASFDVTVKYPPFTVTFVKNDASAKNLDFESMTVDYGSTYKTLPTIEKDNYTFLGWYDAPSGGNKVTKDTTVTKASNHYLYAQWIENGKFRVTFKCEDNDNPTETVPADITGYLGQNIILPGNVGTVPLTKTGYTFVGWAPKDESYNSGAFITASEERLITLYAQWKANEYTITYKDEGDVACTATTNTSPTTHTYGTDTTLVDASKNGYTFDGWFESSGCSGTAVTTIGATTTTADIILYAKWTPQTYTITYKDKDGTDFSGAHGSGYPTQHTYDAATALVSPIKPNNSFDGWYTDSACSSTALTTIGATDYTEDITLYAKWVRNANTGFAAITGGKQQGWVQLWENGPKFAEYNIGSTISDYSQANKDVSAVTSWTSPTAADKTLIASLYATANVGGYYEFGGTTDKDTGKTAGENYSNSTSDIQGTGTAGGAVGSLGDTAKILWGSNWKMPTRANLNKLRNYNDDGSSELTGDDILTTWTWCDGNTTQYVTGCTLAGWKVTGKGVYVDNSIFLPTAGYYYSGLEGQGTYGNYWSSTPVTTDYAYRLTFYSSNEVVDGNNRNNGYCVRAILAE